MPSARNHVAALGAVLALGLGLAGCSTAGDPSYYLLAPSGQAAAEGPQGAATASVIGLRELALPLYARRTQIATVGASGAVTLSDDHRWAEEPPRAATRVVARTLGGITGNTVVIEPWPIGIEPGLRIDVEVDYFAGSLGGDVRLAGQYRIVPGDGKPPTTRSFDLVETAPGDGYDGLVRAHRRALEALARMIVPDLR